MPIALCHAAARWSAAWIAHGVQGARVGDRISVHQGFADLQGSDRDRRHRPGRAHSTRRRHSDRQDERPRVRHGVAHLQQRLRNHAQSLRPLQERGRLERRRGRGSRRGHAAVCRWRRSRWLAAQSRELQQHRRASAKRGPGAECAGADPVCRRHREGRDGAFGVGRGVRAQRGGRSGRARSNVFCITAAGLCRLARA